MPPSNPKGGISDPADAAVFRPGVGINVNPSGGIVVNPGQPPSPTSPENQMMDLLIQKAPEIIEAKLVANWKSWQTRGNFLKPEISFGDNVKNISLSPLGLIHVYRQYFFEFKSFLGPPTGHVWVSPGGTVELYEVSKKRTLTEQTTRFSMETRTLSEISTTTQEELSTAVKEDNQSNEKLGITVSAGGGFPGIFHADATVNYGLETTNKHSQETAHKEMRQQTERLTNEIKRSFESSFKTSTEAEDTISRRHVIQNTSEILKNYELRRKMRTVGIQVQHIGSQLCWQFYVDEPGSDLGIAELIHIAKPADLTTGLIKPELPKPPKPISQEIFVDFPWMYVPNSTRTDLNKLYHTIDGDILIGDENTKIYRTKKYSAAAPDTNYKLISVSLNTVERTGENLPLVDIESIQIPQPAVPDDVGTFQISMRQIHFGGNPYARLKLELVWKSSEVVDQEAIKAAQANYDAEKNRKLKEAFVNAVKERVTLASKIRKRPFSDLRKEERIAVYRRLISQLMGLDSNPTNSRTMLHTMSELIKTIFDIDKMLYFVAPDWWTPRHKYTQQFADPKDSKQLTDSDLVGGSRGNDNRENYLITENSEPAELGSSIGWLLQIDGDEHRNAFLNSPWVQAVIPIRSGMEEQAMNWLSSQHVEGEDGLKDRYIGQQDNFKDIDGDGIIRIDDVISQLGKELTAMENDTSSIRDTEKVFEKGFDPLDEDKFMWKGLKLQVFDQWMEILPTNQIVAVDYDPKEHMNGDIVKNNVGV